jgi:rubrerythrin
MPIDVLLNGYVSLLLLAVTVLALYTAHRQRRFRPAPSQDRIFRCQRCGYVYTDDADVDRSRCFQCGQINEAIKF